MEGKVVVATSKVKSIEVECPQLKKDLIAVMNERNDANQKIKELTEALRVEKALVVQKDEETQATLLKTDEERDKIIQKFKQSEEFSDLHLVVDFFGLDFEKIDIEILEDEARELEEIESDAMEKDPAANKAADRKEVDESTASPS
nr:hypothetical protein CFP56_15578 [Quercus suber]